MAWGLALESISSCTQFPRVKIARVEIAAVKNAKPLIAIKASQSTQGIILGTDNKNPQTTKGTAGETVCQSSSFGVKLTPNEPTCS
jgi:hypothetical protein